jgi:hypothetical protein
MELVSHFELGGLTPEFIQIMKKRGSFEFHVGRKVLKNESIDGAVEADLEVFLKKLTTTKKKSIMA